MVARARRALGESRIGHTGTLDPAATGVLCLVLGRATRLAQFLSASDKTYEAVVRFGFATDTGDAQGCHLHFEAWKAPGWYSGGSPVDPLPMLTAWDKTS